MSSSGLNTGSTNGEVVVMTHDGGDGEVSLAHVFGQPFDFATGVAEDNSLGDGECFVQVTQGLQLPILFKVIITDEKIRSTRARTSTEQAYMRIYSIGH